ncbi:hypothetical protein AKO1_000968 [Acrasis kona]|uniref:Uncharacterized protein n=1 Tax=Acrasis kona TaxID=1008807 RepID=A0AAW2ZCE2_9EUKA
MHSVVILLSLLFSTIVCASIRVALVMEAYDRSIVECVKISETGATGITVLRNSSLTVNYAGDTAVCAINNVGCFFPKESCFCKCQGKSNNILEYKTRGRLAKSACEYWSYYHLKNSTWEYAKTGPSDYKVVDGSVEAWRWDVGDKKLPKLYQFKDICH